MNCNLTEEERETVEKYGCFDCTDCFVLFREQRVNSGRGSLYNVVCRLGNRAHVFGKEKKVSDELDSRTPKWFELWHNKHFKPVKDRSKRNERLIYLLLVVALTSGILANGNGEEIANLLRYLLAG